MHRLRLDLAGADQPAHIIDGAFQDLDSNGQPDNILIRFTASDSANDLANKIVTAVDGAAALDLAYVACGRLDGYFEVGLGSWDIAAGMLLGWAVAARPLTGVAVGADNCSTKGSAA